MLLADGYHDVLPGKVAAVVTYLEMRECPPRRAERADAPWSLRRSARPALDWYRALYRRVGTEWLWSTRLEASDQDLAAILGDPRVEFRALVHEGRDEGLLELDFRQAGACEIAFFGLAPGLLGQGAGRWLMNQAIEHAWAHPIARLWLHTCTLDSPGALEFYRRSGFTPYAVGVEVYDDPRLTGVLPRDAARQVPIIESKSAR